MKTFEFNATPGLTLTCKIFAVGTDVVLYSDVATEKTNDSGRYSVDFDVPVGTYRINGFIGATGGFVNEIYEVSSDSVVYPITEVVISASENQITNYSVLPYTFNVQNRVKNNIIELFKGETPLTSVSCYDVNGDPSDLTGKTLRVSIETRQKVSVQEVTPDISYNVFSFTPSSNVTSSVKDLIWTLWDVTSNSVIISGSIEIRYTAQ